MGLQGPGSVLTQASCESAELPSTSSKKNTNLGRKISSQEKQLYTIDVSPSVEEFLEKSNSWLMSDEVENNGMLSIASAIAKKKAAFSKNAWMASVMLGGEVRGCLINLERDGLMISELPADSIHEVTKLVGDAGIEFSKINGPFVSGVGFAESWSALAKCEWEISHEWRSYIVTKVTMPRRRAEGRLRFAKKVEKPTISEWAVLYEEEKPAPVSVKEFLMYKLDEGELYVWDDHGAKTLVAVSGVTKNCARVSAVFTPKEFRGNGYASMAVAKVTKKLLEKGKSFVTLLVDKHDPKVMRIYERLGYEKLVSRVNIVLSET